MYETIFEQMKILSFFATSSWDRRPLARCQEEGEIANYVLS